MGSADGASELMRTPWLLYRSILGDLLRTTLLTTGVLVTVIAFGAAVPPLSRNLIGPGDLGQFLLLACVPMLQYAVPFAASFAAVSVYHRMSVDREVQAMEAAGLSVRRVLAPVLMLGGILLVGLLALVHLAAPTFWMSMQDLLARDAARLLVGAVSQGEGLRVGNLEIYADEAFLVPDPPETGARERLILSGVAAIELSRGAPRGEFTAEHAVIDVHQGEDGAILKLALMNATAQRADEQAVAVLPQVSPEAIDLGRSLAGDPKGLVLSDLLRARREPGEFRPMREAARPLEQDLRRLEAWECLARATKAGGEASFASAATDRGLRVRDASLEGESLQPAFRDRPIELEELVRGRVVRRAKVASAVVRLDPESGSRSAAPSFEVEVPPGTPAEEMVGGQARPGRWPARIGGLKLAGCEPAPLPTDPQALLAEARRVSESPGDDPARQRLAAEIAGASGGLAALADRFQLDIVARLNQRAAQPLAGLLLPLLGAILAMRSRASAPLGIFVLVFLPAIADMLLISSGEQMTRWGRPEGGLFMMWSTQVAILGLIALAWWRNARN